MGKSPGVLGLILSKIKKDGKVELISCFSILFKSIIGTSPGKKSKIHGEGFASWNFSKTQFGREVRVPQVHMACGLTVFYILKVALEEFIYVSVVTSCITPQPDTGCTAKLIMGNI